MLGWLKAAWVNSLIFLEVESLAAATGLKFRCEQGAIFCRLRVRLFSELLQCLETAHVFWTLVISSIFAAHSSASLAGDSHDMSAVLV